MHLPIKTTALILSSLLSSSLLSWSDSVDVYFGTSGDGGIQHAQFDTGEGTISAPSKVAELSNPGFITIHPEQPYLYSTATTGSKKEKGLVASFKINADNSLTPLNQQSSEGFNACHINIDASGRTVMVANYASNSSVASYQVQKDGSLTAPQSIHTHTGSGTHPKRQKSPHPHSIFPNPVNTFVYVPDLGIDHVEIYALDSQNAKLTPAGNAAVPGGAKGPRHMKFSHDGRFAFVLLEFTLEIAIFEADTETGALNYMNTVSTLKDRSDIERMSSSEIRVHPNGKFIYNAIRDLDSRGRDTICVFALDQQTGKLTLLENEPARVTVPRNFNIDPSGKWLIAGGQKSKDLAIFSIDSNTGLLAPHGENIPFDGSPICIEFLQR